MASRKYSNLEKASQGLTDARYYLMQAEKEVVPPSHVLITGWLESLTSIHHELMRYQSDVLLAAITEPKGPSDATTA